MGVFDSAISQLKPEEIFTDQPIQTFLPERSPREVDSLFVAKRNNRDTIFVVEAKQSSKLLSVAKHKLAYPIFDVLPQIPEDFDIVPVYVRIERRGSSLIYNVAECTFSTSHHPMILTSLSVRMVNRFRLWMPS